MQYDICFKCTSRDALIAFLAPFGLTTVDDAGNVVLATASHDHALAYIGRVVATPPVIDPETGDVTAEATYHDGEYAILRAKEALLVQIMAATMDDVLVLTDPPAGCPTFGGWAPIPLADAPHELAKTKTAACAEIDAEAERRRNAVLTPGAGQMAAYQEKERQARLLLADDTPTEAEYPDIYNEIGVTADSAGEVAMAVLAAAEKWRAYGRLVERVRLSGKKTVAKAGDVAAVIAARDGLLWPE